MDPGVKMTPWNHFRFSAKSWIRPVFQRSESTFYSKSKLSDELLFDQIHCGRSCDQFLGSGDSVSSADSARGVNSQMLPIRIL